MKNQRIRVIGAIGVLVLWAAVTLGAWFSPDQSYSDTERAPLDQKPELTMESLLDASYMDKFSLYVTDQFPLRDTFRQLKAVFHTYGLMQSDNNGKYLQDGYLEDMDYVLDTSALDRAATVFNNIYNVALKGKTDHIYVSIIPDKGYYLAQDGEHLTTDLEAMEAYLLPQMSWAEYIDIKGTLAIEDYYYTDTHWRQEKIADVAQVLCGAMGTTAAGEGDYRITALDRPFYGVYYGQAALPVEPETMYILESDLLAGCKVYSFKDGPSNDPPEIGFYNTAELHSEDMKDPYNVFLYGSQETYVVIENPNAATDRELVIFRDSFGCSMTPLMVQDYARVTVVDLRSVSPMVLNVFERVGLLNLTDADVLFLYSSMVLNNPDSFQAG